MFLVCLQGEQVRSDPLYLTVSTVRRHHRQRKELLMLTDEESKAVQEAAKAAVELKSEIRSFGEFMGTIIGHPLRQAGGLIGDGLGILRMEIAFKYQKRVERIMIERGMNGPQRTIPLSVAYPLLEAASLEEDNDMAEMFAQLLVNATNKDFDGYIPKSFVETVRRMSPLEALILRRMVDAPDEAKTDGGFLYTGSLPERYGSRPEPYDNEYVEPVAPVALALASLMTAGCIELMTTIDGSIVHFQGAVTLYGKELIRACSPHTANDTLR
jgi:hypothetical protein